MRIDEIIESADGAGLLLRVLPAQDRRGRARAAALALESLRAAASPTSSRSPTAPAASTRGRTLELTKWIKQELGIEAMAHLSCVGATREELHAIARRHARRPGSRTSWRCAATRRAGRPTGSPHPGGLQLLDRAGRADPRADYPTRDRRRLLPRGPSRGARPGPRPALPQGEGRRRASRSWSPSCSSTTSCTSASSTRRARPASRCRSCPGSCRSPTSRQIKTITGMCGATIPPALLRGAGVARPRSRRGAAARRLLRHAAVRRAARPRRARASTSTR